MIRLIIPVFLVLVAFYVIYFWKRRKQKKRRLLEEQEKFNKIQNEKEAADKVASLQIDYVDKDEFYKQIQDEVKELKEPKAKTTGRRIEFKF